jgi:hypothetical protein
MLSVNAVISQFLIRYPEAGSTQASVLFNAAYRELCATAEMRNDTTTISLVDGTRSYVLPSGTIEILQAYYTTGPTSLNRRVLLPTTADEYATLRFGYRVGEDNIQGGPQWYWIESKPVGNSAALYISFDPIPDTTTSNGVYNVLLNYNVYTDLSGSDTIPSSLLSETVILQLMQLKWAEQRGDANMVAMYTQTYEAEKQKNVAHIKNTSQQATCGFGVGWSRRRSV